MPDEIPQALKKRHSKNRPTDNAWRQQRLSSVRPELTIRNVFPYAQFLGLALLGLGIGIYFAVEQSLETVIDYTDCTTQEGFINASLISNFSYPDGEVTCIYNFVLDEDYTGDVKFLYGLKGFYQNFRLYLSSRNDLQLAGDIYKISGCDPLDVIEEDDANSSVKIPIAPCGYIANSMFNDTFKLFYQPSNNESMRVPFSTSGIITNLEHKRKFKNPKHNDTFSLCDAFKGTVRPPSWQKDICLLGVNNDTEETARAGVGFENVDFMVWMKPAALPHFRKHYRNLDRESDFFNTGLKAGNYTLIINYNYPASSYNAQKLFIISRESWMGPHNLFLPIVCMVTGIFLILAFLGLFFCFTVKRKFTN